MTTRFHRRRRMHAAEFLEARQLLAADPMISEFLASNRSGLTDDAGNSSDWIELFNAGDAAIDLAGYHLTDDADDLTKWTFPSQTIDPGAFVVVFASGRNEQAADGTLHTNFRLAKSGEYLALIEPDGQSIASEFGPAYPPQETDTSFGVDQRPAAVDLLTGSDRTYAIPTATDAYFAEGWNTQTFDDTEWLPLSGSIGYDDRTPISTVNIASEGIPTQSSTDFNRPATNAIDGNANNFTHTANEENAWWRLTFDEPKSLAKVQLFNRINCCEERLSNFRVSVLDHEGIEVTGQDFFTPDQGGGHAGPGARVDVEFPPGTIGTTIQVQLLGFNAAENGWLSLAEVEVFETGGFKTLIDQDVGDTMPGKSPSALVRHTFDVDTRSPQALNLDVVYDDGFIAYLNGQEVARRNAPDVLDWDATATQDRDSLLSESISLNTWASLLKPADNVLAIHAMNDRVDADVFFFDAKLSATTTDPGDRAYFSEPTPGKFSSTGFDGFVSVPTVSVDRGFFDAPFSTTIAASTPGSSIVYTTDGSPPTMQNGTVVPAEAEDHSPVSTIAIDSTATLRTAAFKDGYEPSEISTQTYIFLNDVIHQPAAPEGLPAVWNGRSQPELTADYEMDPDVVNDPAYADEIIDGLQSIPTISIVMDPDDLFGDERGIYINSGQRGRLWERPTSVEVIEPDGTTFQVDSGIRIHGFSWRFHANTPKHSFRLEFRDEYGPTKLEYPLFPDSPVDKFDSVVLRAQGGRSWGGPQDPYRSQYLRDTFARDLAREMGAVDGHANLVHLYLNGLYWGLYNPVERPDAQMGEEYFGGSSEDYDALNRRTSSMEVIDGDLVRYNEMIDIAEAAIAAGVTTDEQYTELQRYVAIDDFIAFMLRSQYVTNRDGLTAFDGNNQRAIGSRVGDPQFRFFVWDMEYSMWDATDNNNVAPGMNSPPLAGTQNPPRHAWTVYNALRQHPEFRLLYADHAHRHLLRGGALSPEQAAATWEARAESIYTAIIGESARWGDVRREIPFTRDVEWQAERNRLLTEYFPQRSSILLGQLRDVGLYPTVDAPNIQVRGDGPATTLSIESDQGQIYYTMDGSDPRDTSEPSGPRVLIPRGAQWKYLDDGSDQGTAWQRPDFDDSDWTSGFAEFGYGDGDETTVVNCGPSAPSCREDNFPTTYFRTEFEVEDLAADEPLTLAIRRDDGAAIYINGQEVIRTNLPEGPITYQTLANRTGREQTFELFTLSSDILTPGRNVIAVEIHQRTVTNADISFDLQLSTTGRLSPTPSASSEVYNQPLVVENGAKIKARVLHNGAWSALAEQTATPFVPADADRLRISEIHYHPKENEDAEFVELVNVSDETIDLIGVKLTEGIEFEFSRDSRITQLGPGERLVVVQSLDGFAVTYGLEDVAVAGEFSSGRLANSSDRVNLLAANGAQIAALRYQDTAPWPAAADGQGPSLVLNDLGSDPAQGEHWRSSFRDGGTPGRPEAIPGDSNGDGLFDHRDLDFAFAAGEYEDAHLKNSTLSEGDWNGDGEFTSEDFVYVFQLGHYRPG